ncbi:hypothetical protein EVAR_97549_1 [Eumeta japonica]|uniref:Uncharacterized protein n=1 Tax=Eumeta variegata TaxID=151549 RepID=A0A4C1SCK6_EUMVA|nr:hypothetical protein EVAR_97549_1 [Eumeta japonica]
MALVRSPQYIGHIGIESRGDSTWVESPAMRRERGERRVSLNSEVCSSDRSDRTFYGLKIKWCRRCLVRYG